MMNAENTTTEKPGEKPIAEIALCLYAGGKMALKVDDGEKVPVKDLDTAVTAIRRFAESETEDAGQQPGEQENPAEEAAPNEEQDFQAGFKGPQGGAPGY